MHMLRQLTNAWVRANGWAVDLAPLVGKPALAGAVVDVILGIDLAHRMLALALFLRLRGDAGDARDDEQRVGDFSRDADVAADSRDRAVDVHRPRVAVRQGGGDELDGTDHLDVAAFDLQ